MKSLVFQSFILFFVVATSNLMHIGEEKTFNIIDFGGIGDGNTDNCDAFSKAWNALCALEKNNISGGTPTLLVPQGLFLLKPITFQGPCKSDNINIKIEGNIVAPRAEDWGGCDIRVWLMFDSVNGLILTGTGTLDGQGSTWWKNSEIMNKCMRPRALQFQNCQNVKVQGLTHINSPRAHIGIDMCQLISFYGIKIFAPENSPNTDGIHIAHSTHIDIFNSTIGTGDDCVAINGGCSFINVTQVTCGPGHGISVGSLGDCKGTEFVEDVNIQHCTFLKTKNGVRIKTTPGGSGHAKRISFTQIRLYDTKNPIIIDQHYCDGRTCREKERAVEVSEIKYMGIQGTSASKQAITLDCDKIGCCNVVMDHINISSSSPEKDISSFCKNVNGTSTSTIPVVPCLQST